VTPLHDASGVHIGFAKITRDLTDRRQSEETNLRLAREQAAREAAQQLAQRAEEANRIKDEFLATVSHELRTPLNAIVGWAAILRQQSLDASVSKAVEVIDRNARAQAKIIDDILDVSRIVTGKLKIEPEAVDLVAVTRAAIEVVLPTAAVKQIRIQFDAQEPSAWLIGDADRLQQVVWNLLSNAVKFTTSGGSIQVRVARGGSSVSLNVTDTGQGIEPDFLPFVFERFKQADASTTRRIGGLGLGLALVRHLVELHGGMVTAHSPGLGLGSTFAITLPIRAVIGVKADAEQGAQAASAPAPSQRTVLQGVRILVVDDDEDARELLTTVLTRAGASVESAGSAAQGYAALVQSKPHVLVSDIGMADEDGYSFLRRVRALPAADGGKIPALALIAYNRNEDRNQALAAGFTTHLGKPVNPNELLAAVARLAAPPA
jgi:signal transduction histidine kinase/ActR/RegA family two-component response regulator